MLPSLLKGQEEGILGVLCPTRLSQAPRVTPVIPGLSPLLLLSKMAPGSMHLHNPTIGEGMTQKVCLYPVNQVYRHTLLQGLLGNVVFSWGGHVPRHTLGVPLLKGRSRHWILGNLSCSLCARKKVWAES